MEFANMDMSLCEDIQSDMLRNVVVSASSEAKIVA